MRIEHETEAHRFVAPLDQGEAYLAYTETAGGALNLAHTVVPPAERGHGVGEALVEHALQYARDEGRKVIPSCPFVQSWMQENPEYENLIARA
jgi:predicted GNAT family acetyltransferase